MFRSFSGQPSPSNDNATYQQALSALRQEIAALEINLEHTKNVLANEYTAEALSSLAQHFESISSRFIRYTRETKSLQYLALSRSDGRKRAAGRIINSAKETAMLFERYARRPKTYSRVQSRLKIDAVLADLSTLKSYC